VRPLARVMVLMRTSLREARRAVELVFVLLLFIVLFILGKPYHGRGKNSTTFFGTSFMPIAGKIALGTALASAKPPTVVVTR